MKQITITRDEFRERIVKNKRGFGIVRALREAKDGDVKNINEKLALEEIAQIITLMQIEEELFGEELSDTSNAEYKNMKGGDRHKKKSTCDRRCRSDFGR